MLLAAALSLVTAHSALAAEAPSPTITPAAVYARQASGAASAPSTYETTSPLPLTE